MTQRFGLRETVGALVLLVLMVPGIVAHEPVFGDGAGLRAAGWGVGLGVAVAVAARTFAWRWWTTLAVTVLVYLGFGAVAALPDTAVGSVWPTVETVQLLVLQVVHSWKDLLTLVPPASAFVGPAVLPYLTGLVTAVLGGLAAVTGRWLLASLAPVVLYLVGAAWSVPLTGAEPWWAVAGTVAMLAWWAVSAAWDRAVADPERPHRVRGHAEQRIRRRARTRTLVSAAVVLSLSAAIAVPLAAVLVDSGQRTVLRSYLAPPLNVQERATPLQLYRHLNAQLADEPLLRVTGLPEDARLRIATMDHYDGVQWGIAEPNEGEGFFQVGESLPEAVSEVPSGARRDVDVELEQLRPIDGWVPSVGHPEQLSIDDEATAAALFYDPSLQSLLTTATPASPLQYRLQGWTEPVWSEGQLSGRSLGSAQQPEPEQIPSSLPSLAAEITAAVSSPLEQARALEQYFHSTGYYANSTENPSRPGHTAERIARLIDAEQMIGDDEQYATAMALAARSLGLPARVVMGVYPDNPDNTADTAQTNESTRVLHGRDLSVWVEIPFAGAGWVPFDPTPPRDQTPQTEIPEPRQVPRPQVLQPPEPPQEPPELPAELRDEENPDPLPPESPVPWGLIAGISGLVLLLLLPLLGVPLYKLWRRRRRRQATGRLGVRHAWTEVTDYAVDVGITVPRTATVLESADIIVDSSTATQDTRGAVTELARSVGRTEFSGAEGSAGADDEDPSRKAWELAERSHRGLQPAGLLARHRTRMSWRSLIRRRKERR